MKASSTSASARMTLRVRDHALASRCGSPCIRARDAVTAAERTGCGLEVLVTPQTPAVLHDAVTWLDQGVVASAPRTVHLDLGHGPPPVRRCGRDMEPVLAEFRTPTIPYRPRVVEPKHRSCQQRRGLTWRFEPVEAVWLSPTRHSTCHMRSCERVRKDGSRTDLGRQLLGSLLHNSPAMSCRALKRVMGARTPLGGAACIRDSSPGTRRQGEVSQSFDRSTSTPRKRGKLCSRRRSRYALPRRLSQFSVSVPARPRP